MPALGDIPERTVGAKGLADLTLTWSGRDTESV
jgi:hypothetical protein